MDRARRIIKDGAIAINENKIVGVGKTDELIAKYKGEKIIDAEKMVVLPGFINTHTHFYETLLRGLGDNYQLFDWLHKIVYPITANLRKEDVYYASLLSCLELIRTGCTCTMDNHFHRKTYDDCLRAMLDIGIRGIEAREHVDMDRWNLLPPELVEDSEKQMKDNVRLLKKWHGKGNGRLHVWFGMRWPPFCSNEILETAYDLSREHGVGITMHLHGGEEEVRRWKEETGYSPIQYYNKNVKILGPNLLAVHCAWTDDEDIQVLKESATKVSHCPISNMYFGSGIASIPKMLKRGIPVGLGVDGAANNDNQDMLELMKVTALLHRAFALDPSAIDAKKVLEMATIDGAKALNLENEIGSIEPGKKADVVLINLKRANTIPIRVPSQLVYCAKGSNVDTVIIDGEVVLENGKIKTVNEEEILEKAQKLSDELLERCGVIECVH